MTTHVDKEATVSALAEEFGAIGELLAGLDDKDWRAPSPCPGWDVQANVAHIIGTESTLAGMEAPQIDVDVASLSHVRNDIGAFNEAWIVALAATPPAELLERYRTLTGERLDSLRSMDQEAWEKEGFTPAGQDTYGRFMRVRIMDCWMHEQDIRQAVGAPGHDAGAAVEHSLDEMDGALGFVVGKKAGAPQGSSVTFDLTGPAARQIHVAVDGRAAVVDALPGTASATVRMPVLAFSRLAGGRADAATDQVEVEGDRELGDRVVANLGFMI